MNRITSNMELFLEYKNIEYPIEEPQRFDQVKIVISRDKDYLGFLSDYLKDDLKLLFDESSEELPRTKANAAQLLRQIATSTSIDSEGFDSAVFLIIRKNGIELFKGKLDLNDYKDTDEGFEAKSERVSFEDLIRTRFETAHDYSSTQDADGNVIQAGVTTDIELHSKAFKRILRETQTEDLEPTLDNLVFTNVFIASINVGFNTDSEDTTKFFQFSSLDNVLFDEIDERFTLPLGASEEYDKGANIESPTEWQEAVTDFGSIPLPSGRFRTVLSGRYKVNFRLSGRIYVDMSLNLSRRQSGGIEFRIKTIHTDQDGNVKGEITHLTLEEPQLIDSDLSSFNKLIKYWNIDLNGNHIFDAIGESNFYQGDNFYLVMQCYVFGVWEPPLVTPFDVSLEAAPLFNTNTFFNVDALTVAPNSYAKACLPFEALEKTIEGVTGLPNRLRSSLLGRTDSSTAYPANGEASQILLTNGYGIRGFPYTERPFFFSVADLYETFEATHGAGLGFETESGNDVLVLEKRSYFFKDVEILNFPNPSNYSIEPAKDFIYNEIEIGYDKFADEQLNNIDEFNTKQERVTGVRSLKKKFKKISKYLASGYLLEFARRKGFKNAPTEDTDQDEDNFLISSFKKHNQGDTIALNNIEIQVNQTSLRIKLGLENFNAVFQIGSAIVISGTTNYNGTYTASDNGVLLNEVFTVAIQGGSLPVAGFEIGTISYVTDKDIYEPEKNEAVTATNVISPETSYNFRLSPLRMLIRSIDWIKISTTFKDELTHKINFVKGELNYLLNTSWNNQLSEIDEYDSNITERENLLLSKVNVAPLLKPEKHIFNHFMTESEFNILRNAHTGNGGNLNYGYITVTDHRSNENKLYLLSLEYDINEKEAKIEAITKFS
mgnify:CR=1 FL=1